VLLIRSPLPFGVAELRQSIGFVWGTKQSSKFVTRLARCFGSSSINDRLGAVLLKISSHVQNQLSDADWNTKRQIIRASALIQRIALSQRKSQSSCVYRPRPPRVPGIQLW
jgi:hypothetical protein